MTFNQKAFQSVMMAHGQFYIVILFPLVRLIEGNLCRPDTIYLQWDRHPVNINGAERFAQVDEENLKF